MGNRFNPLLGYKTLSMCLFRGIIGKHCGQTDIREICRIDPTWQKERYEKFWGCHYSLNPLMLKLFYYYHYYCCYYYVEIRVCKQHYG